MRNARMIFAALLLLISNSALAKFSGTPASLVNVDLLQLQAQLAPTMTAEEVAAQNQLVIDSLPKEIGSKGRITKVSKDFANHLVDSISMHPIAGFADHKYQQEHVKIGYCFGRATYGHLSLLKLGVDKRAIKKIWAVGPMNSGAVNWAFHVSTIVLGDTGEWYTIDNFSGHTMTLKEWMTLFQGMNKNGKLMFFVTEPQKFTASLDTYSRVQLGLDLDPKKDWYKSYFKDLMAWFAKGDDAMKFYSDYSLVPLK